MNRSILALLPVVALSSIIGCSGGGSAASPFGADPDFQSIQARMASPDGTFNSQNAAAVFAQYSTQQSGATSSDVAGAASAGTSGAASLHGGQIRLSDVTPTASGCSDLSLGNLTGSCACPGGGTFAYDYSGLAEAEQSSATIDVTLRVAMSECVTDSGTIDGREFVHMHEDRAVASSTSAPTDASVLLVLDVTATSPAGNTVTLDVNELLTESPQGDSVQIAVQVNDGWVVVSASTNTATGSATYSVRDKNGTWTCSETNGTGSCTDPQGDVTTFATTSSVTATASNK